MTEIKNLYCATFGLFISLPSTNRIKSYVRKHAKRKWLSGCAEIKALLGIFINHMVILSSKSHKPLLAVKGMRYIALLTDLNYNIVLNT